MLRPRTASSPRWTRPRPLDEQEVADRASGARSASLRNLVIAGAIIGFLVLLYIGIDTILQTQDADAETIAELSYSIDEVGLFDSYAATAWVYGMLPPLMRDLTVYLTAFGFMAIVMWRVRSAPILGLAGFLLIAPFLLFLPLFNKETVLLPFLFLTYAAITGLKTNQARFFAIAAIYLVYGFFFRQYFLLIFGVVGYLMLLRAATPLQRVAMLAVSFAFLFLLPTSVFRTLNEARDVLNYYRVGYSNIGYRTVFLNLTTLDTPIGFLMNYGYAFLRLNFPVLFELGLKEAFLMSNMLLYFALAGIGLKWGSDTTKTASLLFISHLLVLTVFEPDLGSYLRHASAGLVFLAPALGTLDRLLWARGRAPRGQPREQNLPASQARRARGGPSAARSR